jgi:hypothetical protein
MGPGYGPRLWAPAMGPGYGPRLWAPAMGPGQPPAPCYMDPALLSGGVSASSARAGVGPGRARMLGRRWFRVFESGTSMGMLGRRSPEEPEQLV